ncbi:MAG: CRISPR-associated endoribonuclease Cas6 [Marinilabiliaceae bacterium]|nr:CRISPR-associated endoribonuclease Cas6 [Marinilabiliaceae bacterium]
MRFQISFVPVGRHRMLPIDYQYYISAWIYKVMARADAGFADFLHQQGYRNGYKQFKHFCFSPLNIGRPTFWKEKGLLEMHADRAHLMVSFGLGNAAEHFVYGLFRDQRCYVGDRFNGIDMQVENVERIPDVVAPGMMRYQARSPIVASLRADGLKHALYLAPDDGSFVEVIYRNLIDKAASMPMACQMPPLDEFVISNIVTPKPKLVTIKPYTPQQSKVKGYTFGFTLDAPPAVHQLIAGSGLGEKNAMGFGWCDACL